jgi:hypothetical protein
VIISTDAGKAVDKIHIPYDKSPEETRDRRIILQHDKDYIQQTQIQHHME